MLRSATVALLAATLLVGAAAAGVAAATGNVRLHISAPRHVDSGTTAAITLRLPASVAAVDGRIFFDSSVAEVVGVSAGHHGTALTPQEIAGGFAFGVYGMDGSGSARITIAVATSTDGRLPFRVVVDSAAGANGLPLAVVHATAKGKVVFGTSGVRFSQPRNLGRRFSNRAPGRTRDVVPDGKLAVTDLDLVRAGWEVAHLNDDPCAASLDFGADANSDGCIDIVDLQAVLASQSWTVVNGVASSPAAGRSSISSTPSAQSPGGGSTESVSTPSAANAAATTTFTVNTTADAVDAHNGDGVCADSQGRCTLRAAITESNWASGANTINFDISGSAPITIQLSSSLPQLVLQDRSGGTLINGYSQPGSHVNTATSGSNATPGIYLVGTANSPKQNGVRITSAYNTIRGIIFNRHDRSIVIDGTDAHDNLIAGDWLNYEANGSASSYKAHYNFWIANGATHNAIGTPALADRNLTGRATKGGGLYGPGTDYNLIQNTLFCMTPSGNSTATCDVGTDFSFGPKHNLIGGSDPAEANVYGATTQQCIEFAHDNGINNTDTWKNADNSIIGNWLGFRADGSYSSSFRCGSNTPSSKSNDSNGINLADGSPDNLVQGNWIGSWWDGINIMSGNEDGNVVRDNIIGESPLGQAAPIGRYGIGFRTHAHDHIIEGNVIRNAATYGIALMGSDIIRVKISRNIITDTSGDAIHLVSGSNNSTATPSITSATTAHVSGTGIAGATVEIFQASRSAGNSGLPIAYLGSAVVASNGSWTAAVAGISSGDRVTALQFTPTNNTSELSTNVTASFEQPPTAPSANFSWSQGAGTTIAFQDTSTGSISLWSWDFGDGATSSNQNPNHTYAAAGNYSVKLTVSNAGGPDSRTRTVSVQSAPPPPADAIVSDAFGRTSSNSWESADTGGSYTLSGNSANYDVSAGVGTIVVPKTGATRSALLDSASASDVDITFRVAVDKVAAGGSDFIYAVARRNGSSEYRPRMILKADGSVSVSASVVASGSESPLGSAVVVPGLTQSAGSFIWFRAQVTGSSPTTIRVKAWAAGTSEPSGWSFSTTNNQSGLQSAGSLGLRVYVANKSSVVPVTFSFDDYSVVPAAAPPPPGSGTVVADAFGRTSSNSWESADTGGSYTLSGNSANYDVSAGVGTIVVPKTGATRSALLDSASASDVDITFRVAVDKVAAGGSDFIYAVARRNGSSEYRPRMILKADGSVSVSASVVASGSESPLGSAVVVPGLTQSAGSFIWFRAQVTGSSPTTIRVKAWAAGTSEPSGWSFSTTNNQSGLQSAGSLGLRVYVANKSSVVPVTFSFDDYSVSGS